MVNSAHFLISSYYAVLRPTKTTASTAVCVNTIFAPFCHIGSVAALGECLAAELRRRSSALQPVAAGLGAARCANATSTAKPIPADGAAWGPIVPTWRRIGELRRSNDRKPTCRCSGPLARYRVAMYPPTSWSRSQERNWRLVDDCRCQRHPECFLS